MWWLVGDGRLLSCHGGTMVRHTAATGLPPGELGGVAAAPTYNRLTWNFTNGEGEVALAQATWPSQKPKFTPWPWRLAATPGQVVPWLG